MATALSDTVRDTLGSLTQTCHELETLLLQKDVEATTAHNERLRLHQVTQTLLLISFIRSAGLQICIH